MEFLYKISVNLIKYRIIFLIIIAIFDNNYAIGQGNAGEILRKVVIDAGHGGRDPGTIGKKVKEKDITLAIALKLGYYIEKNFPDVEIIYTRKTDKFIPLDERSQIANSSNANLFISIHCNANPSKNPFGAETYVMGLHKSDENLNVAQRENAVITYEEDYSMKYEGYDPGSSESYIIFSLMQNAFLDQSLNLASIIQDEFRLRAHRKDRGVKQAGFLVLWKTSMPSVLVEVGYLSNQKEELYLVSESGQDYLTSAIFRAFREYKQNYDSKSSITAKIEFDQTLNNKVEEKNTSLSSNWTDDEVEDSEQSDAGIVFRVQITASSKRIPLQSAFFKNLKDIEEVPADEVYKYVTGNKKTYSEIIEYCQEVRKFFPDAFIVAIKKGKTIPIDIALKELASQPASL